MSVEMVEPDDFPRTGTRAEINRYLERFYNENAARNTYVPYGFWESGGTRELPGARAGPAPGRRVRRVSGDARPGAGAPSRSVRAGRRLPRPPALEGPRVRQPGHRRTGRVDPAEFGFSVDTPDSLKTVADVVLAAAGQGVSAKPSDLKAPPAAGSPRRATGQPWRCRRATR